MATPKQVPKSIRFEAEVERMIQELTVTFDESPVRLLHRAVEYLYENQEAAVDAEAQKRKDRIQKKK